MLRTNWMRGKPRGTGAYRPKGSGSGRPPVRIQTENSVAYDMARYYMERRQDELERRKNVAALGYNRELVAPSKAEVDKMAKRAKKPVAVKFEPLTHAEEVLLDIAASKRGAKRKPVAGRSYVEYVRLMAIGTTTERAAEYDGSR